MVEGKGARRIVLAVGITAGSLAGCREQPKKPLSTLSPEATITAISQEQECLDLRPSLEACASRVEFSFVEPRFNQITHLVTTSQILESSKNIMTDTLLTMFTMQEEGRIRWYVYHQEKAIGTTQLGRSRLVLPYVGKDFFVNLVLPREQALIQSEVLGTTFHETLHGVRAYQRFQEGADPAFDVAPEEEEYEAEYYELLMTKIAKLAGISGEEKGKLLNDFGIDLTEVVYYLDQNQIGPESQLYHYLSDWRIRYLLKRSCKATEGVLDNNSPDRTLRKKLEEMEAEIRDIEKRWGSFPDPGSRESGIIQMMKTQGGWVSSSFFSNSQEERNGDTKTTVRPVSSRVPRQSSLQILPKGVFSVRTTKGFPKPRYM